MDYGLAGQRVLVTGSSQGIGKAIASLFLSEGCHVTLNGRNANKLALAKLELSEHSAERISTFAGDLTHANTINELASAIKAEGGIHHLICNIGNGKSTADAQFNYQEWLRMFEINFFSAVQCISSLLPLLTESTTHNFQPTITLISSICGNEGLGPASYATAKAATNAYVNNMARQLGPKGIRINVVSPGNVLFPGSTWEQKMAEDPQAVTAMLENEVPLQRFATPEDIANTVVFLSSSRASFVTGANWVVDGGQTRSI